MHTTWQPLLEGAQAERAWRAIDAIAAEIEPMEARLKTTGSGESLAGGGAGIALFYAYLAAAKDDEALGELACDTLQRALEGVVKQPFSPGLWSGLLGVSWVFDHLAGRLFELDDEDVEVSDSDEVLIRLLQDGPAYTNYDLIDGLVGFGVACLEGLERAGARRGLDLVLDHLILLAERRDPGIAWLTPPTWLPDWQRQLAPDGYYNLGVAHGMPAIVTFLARCIRGSVRVEELTPVLDDLVRWILAQRGDLGFPTWVPKGRAAGQGARLAWCYGDPGIAAALLAAGRAVERADWQDAAAEIARSAAARDVEAAGVKDAGICHGAAGLAHLFHRLHRGTGDPSLAAAARLWFERTLDMRHGDRGVGGYQSWSIPRGDGPGGELQWVDEPGLLTGASGVGLCLLAAVSEEEPAWDCVLAVS